MPTLISAPTIMEAAGYPPKEIAEYFGRVTTATTAVSIAKMTASKDDAGKVLVPGKPNESRLLGSILDETMPKDGKPLSPDDAVRTAILLRAAVPAISASANSLNTELGALYKLRAEIVEKKEEVAAGAAQLIARKGRPARPLW